MSPRPMYIGMRSGHLDGGSVPPALDIAHSTANHRPHQAEWHEQTAVPTVAVPANSNIHIENDDRPYEDRDQ